jgi:hypothetical protein
MILTRNNHAWVQHTPYTPNHSPQKFNFAMFQIGMYAELMSLLYRLPYQDNEQVEKILQIFGWFFQF